MMNQNGQAFSVFELMIAAIVAVAILFVLLPMLQPPVVNDFAVKAVGNGLLTVKGGGSMNTSEFTLKKDDLVTSKMFSDKGFGQTSIVFDVDKSISSTVLVSISSTDEKFSSLKYTGAVDLPAVAKIICEQTGKSLEETLIATSIETTVTPTDLCGEDSAQPCCIVIVKRA